MTPTQRDNIRQALMKVPTDMLLREMQRRQNGTCERLHVIARKFGITTEEMFSPSQSHRFTEARVAAAAKMRFHHGMKASAIASEMRTSHDRVYQWMRQHHRFMKTRPAYAKKYLELTEIV